MTRVCDMGCGSELGSRNKSGRCRSCAMREMRKNPEIEALRAAAFSRALATNPEMKARHCARSAATLAKWRKTPEGSAFIRSNAVTASAASNMPDAKRRRAASIRQTMTGWCPDDRRDEYLDLRRYHGAAEARRIIEADLAEKERRRLAALTPFERMQEHLANGGTLIEKPVLRRAEHAFSLTGGSLA